MELRINGKISTPAPITIIVAPLHEIPNLPPGYYEVSRWVDGTGTTSIRCWPSDATKTRMSQNDPAIAVETGEPQSEVSITAENLAWAGTGSLRSTDHVAVIEEWQNVALCGVNVAGMREIRPMTLNLCRGCARELRKLSIDPGDIGIENDLA